MGDGIPRANGIVHAFHMDAIVGIPQVGGSSIFIRPDSVEHHCVVIAVEDRHTAPTAGDDNITPFRGGGANLIRFCSISNDNAMVMIGER